MSDASDSPAISPSLGTNCEDATARGEQEPSVVSAASNGRGLVRRVPHVDDAYRHGMVMCMCARDVRDFTVLRAGSLASNDELASVRHL